MIDPVPTLGVLMAVVGSAVAGACLGWTLRDRRDSIVAEITRRYVQDRFTARSRSCAAQGHRADGVIYVCGLPAGHWGKHRCGAVLF